MDRLLANRLLVQDRVIKDVYKSYKQGNRRILVEAKTGFGKTHVAAAFSRNSVSKGNSVLFVTPRRRLTDQASKVFSSYSESPVSYLMAGRHFDENAMVHVACDKTLNLRMERSRKAYKSNNLFEFLSGADLPKFNVIMIDECHIGDATPLMHAYPDAVFIGFSATPAKGDGTGLGDQYEDKVLGPTTKELIDLGLLLPVRVYNSDIEIDEDDGNDPVLIGNVIDNWKACGEDRQTVLYAKSLKHSQYLVDRFNEAGIKAEHIDYRVSDEPGDDGKSERDRIYDRLTSGETKVLCNYKLVRFGVDIPPVGCVVLANPNNNMVLRVTDFLQAVGRGRRPFGDQNDMILIDHTKTVEEHGHPDEEFDFPLHTTRKETLERLKRKKREEQQPEPKKIKCLACNHKFDYQLAKRGPKGLPECPKCGAPVNIVNREYVEEVDAELVEFGKDGVRKQEHKVTWTRTKVWNFCREVLGYYVGKPTKNVPARIFHAQKDKGIPDNLMLKYDEIWQLEALPCSLETKAFIDNKRKQWYAIQRAIEAKKKKVA